MPKGGKRQGAGRKPGYVHVEPEQKRKQRGIALSDIAWQALKEKAKTKGVSVSALIEAFAKR